MTTDLRNGWSHEDHEPIPEGCTFTKGCARCDAPGHILRFQEMKRPIVDPDGTSFGWWALCPVSEDPILMRKEDSAGRSLPVPEDIMEGLDEAWEYAWEEWTEPAAARLRLLGPGAALIVAERARQVSAEGWSAEHDDGHTTGDLARAASCYLEKYSEPHLWNEERHPDWPWDDEWNPSVDPIRNLVKAGALIAAEIDRLNRAGHPVPDDEC